MGRAGQQQQAVRFRVLVDSVSFGRAHTDMYPRRALDSLSRAMGTTSSGKETQASLSDSSSFDEAFATNDVHTAGRQDDRAKGLHRYCQGNVSNNL